MFRATRFENASTLDLLVAVLQHSQLLLASSVPHIEAHHPLCGGEVEDVDLGANSGDILLLELASLKALHVCCLANTSIADKNKLELMFRTSSLRDTNQSVLSSGKLRSTYHVSNLRN